MQTKTICKTIENKLEDWLSTITDEKLAKNVRKHLLLSGGAITSMFLNTDVNDYDIYIQDRDTLVALTEYYTKDYENIMIMFGWQKEIYEKSDAYRTVEDENDGDALNIFSICVQNLKPDQVKLYFKDKTGSLKITKTDDKKYTPLFFSPNAISLSDNIQIVIRFYGTPEEIHKTFDFVHATNYFTFKDRLVTNIEALESILSRQLYYQGSLYPITTIIRMKKFIKRNWNISAGEILKVLFQVSELNLKDPNILEEQLIGVDIAYFGMLIQALRNVNPDKLNSEYINKIIDKVFNSEEPSDL